MAGKAPIKPGKPAASKADAVLAKAVPPAAAPSVPDQSPAPAPQAVAATVTKPEAVPAKAAPVAATPVSTAASAVKPAIRPVRAAKPVTAPKPAAEKPVPAKPVPAPPAPTVEAKKPEPVAVKAPTPQIPAPAIVADAVNQEAKTMQDTIQSTAAAGTDRANAIFGEMNDRAKTAMEKSSKLFEDMNEFAKGNLEAFVESSRIAAKGAEDIAKYSADYGRKAIANSNETSKKFASIKSPTELFELQSELLKSSIDAFVAETSKFTESYLKLMGDVAQPISNRVAVAVEKVKVAA